MHQLVTEIGVTMISAQRRFRKYSPGRRISLEDVQILSHNLTDLGSKWVVDQHERYMFAGRLPCGLESMILDDVVNSTLSGFEN